MSLKIPINQMASQQIATRLRQDLTFNSIPSCRLAAAMQKALCNSDIGHYRSAGKEWMVMGLKSRLRRREDGGRRNLPTFLKECSATSLHDFDQKTWGVKKAVEEFAWVWRVVSIGKLPPHLLPLNIFYRVSSLMSISPPPIPLFYTTQCSGNCPPTEQFLVVESNCPFWYYIT